MTRAQLRHFRAPLACGLASPEALAMVGLTSLTMGLVRLVPRADAGRAADACRSLFGVRFIVSVKTARDHLSRFGGQGGLRRRIESPAVLQSAGGLLGFEDRAGCLPEGGPALRGDDGVRRFGREGVWKSTSVSGVHFLGAGSVSGEDRHRYAIEQA